MNNPFNYKYTRSDLAQRMSLPLQAKVTMAMQRIRQFYDYKEGQVFIAFSGGKDSTVLRHLVKDMYPDVPAVYVQTGLDYPEVMRHARKYADVVVYPEIRFDQVLKKYGYPVISKDVSMYVEQARQGKQHSLNRLNGLDNDGTPSRWNEENYAKWKFLLDAPFAISEKCCGVMKQSPIDKWARKNKVFPYVGIMAAESARRTNAWLKTGCNIYDGKRAKSKPLSCWTEQDILQYIVENHLEIPSVYGEIVPKDQTEGQLFMDGLRECTPKLKTTGRARTGCMFCMFCVQCDKTPNRFQRMKVTHPKQWDYCIREENGLGLGKILDYLGIPYE